MNKLENYRPCAEVRPVTAKLLLLMLRDITDDHDQITSHLKHPLHAGAPRIGQILPPA